MAKIRRNQPCPCGSGRKFKKCHGGILIHADAANAGQPQQMPPALEAALRARQADELLRTRAEGHGRPVVSDQLKDYRIVAVKDKVFYSKDWRFFTDFLLHHMQHVMSPGWAKRMAAAEVAHPLLGWLSRMDDLRKAAGHVPGNVMEAKQEGFILAVFRFAYS